jgi:hypothetical protein
MQTAAASIVTWMPRPEDRLFAALRYVGVLVVWALLALIRPRLAWDIFVHRRPDSPIPRRRERRA